MNSDTKQYIESKGFRVKLNGICKICKVKGEVIEIREGNEVCEVHFWTDVARVELALMEG